MPRMIFVNLPVSSLPASMAFYEALGFANNPQFTDETAACMVWSEAIYVMLLTHDKWRTFTDRRFRRRPQVRSRSRSRWTAARPSMP